VANEITSGVVGELIDVPGIVAQSPLGEWRNLVLTTVNDSVVRLGVIEGEYHWHLHEREDEFFMTLEGVLELDLRDADGTERSVTLFPLEAFTVPRGVVHRTRAEERTTILMVEQATVAPAGTAADA
jgi:mannose-6-phosphate isomerase-like protein (cupin superfamily)